MAKISNRHIKAWEKFNEELKRYWSMDAIELDRLQDCETNDNEEEGE